MLKAVICAGLVTLAMGEEGSNEGIPLECDNDADKDAWAESTCEKDSEMCMLEAQESVDSSEICMTTFRVCTTEIGLSDACLASVEKSMQAGVPAGEDHVITGPEEVDPPEGEMTVEGDPPEGEEEVGPVEGVPREFYPASKHESCENVEDQTKMEASMNCPNTETECMQLAYDAEDRANCKEDMKTCTAAIGLSEACLEAILEYVAGDEVGDGDDEVGDGDGDKKEGEFQGPPECNDDSDISLWTDSTNCQSRWDECMAYVDMEDVTDFAQRRACVDNMEFCIGNHQYISRDCRDALEDLIWGYRPPEVTVCKDPDWSECIPFFTEKPHDCEAGIACFEKFELALRDEQNCRMSKVDIKNYIALGRFEHCPDVEVIEVARIHFEFQSELSPEQEIDLSDLVCNEVIRNLRTWTFLSEADLYCRVVRPNKGGYNVKVDAKETAADHLKQYVTFSSGSMDDAMAAITAQVKRNAVEVGLQMPLVVENRPVTIKLPGDRDDDAEEAVEEETGGSSLAVGLGVGLPLAFVAIAGIVFVVLRRKRPSEKQKRRMTRIGDNPDADVAVKIDKVQSAEMAEMDQTTFSDNREQIQEI